MGELGIDIDIVYKSLNKVDEELCGDKVEILHTADSHILILADGMGSGVKANILATLTSKILGTMILNGAPLEDCVETIIKTLPLRRDVMTAYATFSVLQIFDNGEVYLAEYDNPPCIFVRDGKLEEIPRREWEIQGKMIHESRFQAKEGDAFVLVSDGTLYAGTGEFFNPNWTWESMADYAVKSAHTTSSAARMAWKLVGACNDLYDGRPGDDTTAAVLRVRKKCLVKLMTGPPRRPEDDEEAVRQLMEGKDVIRIVSGGTSANIVSRILGKAIRPDHSQDLDPDIPPISQIDGIDLVTEGVLTLSRALELLEEYYFGGKLDDDFFEDLDKENGGSMIAQLLMEDCTDLEIILGTAANAAYQNPELAFRLHSRHQLVDKLKNVMEKIGKRVTIVCY